MLSLLAISNTLSHIHGAPSPNTLSAHPREYRYCNNTVVHRLAVICDIQRIPIVLPALEKYPDFPFMLDYLAFGWFSWEARGIKKCLMDFILNPVQTSAKGTVLYEIKKEFRKNLTLSVV